MKLSNENEKGLEKQNVFQKIAISTDSGIVSSHFGRCPEFTIVEIENNNVVNKEVIPNPGHKTGFLPGFFNEKGVNYVIAGGAGSMAQQFFDKYNIKLIVGVQGKIDQVIDDFIHNKLEKGNSMCKPGDGKDYGIEKEDKKPKKDDESKEDKEDKED